MEHDRQLPESVATNAVSGAAGNVVQAAAIHGDVHVTHVAPHPTDGDVVRRAQDQTIAAYRRLDDVQAQLAQVQQQLLDSVKAERNITQLVLVLRFVLMRLQDMITQLTWQRDHYQNEAGRIGVALVRNQHDLAKAHRSKERAQRQLDHALDERELAVELIAVLQRKIDIVEQQLRARNSDIGLAQDVVPANLPVFQLPGINVGGDLDDVDVVVDCIGNYLGDQHRGLSQIADQVVSSRSQRVAQPGRQASTTSAPPVTRDELTALLNRRGAMKVLRELLDDDRSDGGSANQTAVLLCDIDNFKRINDSLGHDAGDELLVALARRLEGGLPTGCTVARLSGDEYVIICADIDAVGGVDTLANRVSTLLRTAVPVRGHLIRVSASVGAAVLDDRPATAEDLLRFADAAMFEAKKRGVGRVVLASAALIAVTERQVQLEGELREALASDSMVLHFQPVVGADGTMQTAEALVRWPHPDRGMLAPDVFLPVAEQGGLMRELDRWVLRNALCEAATWPLHCGKPVAVAVNLAGLVPGDPEFVDIVANAVLESGIEWDRVVLELVETSLIDLPSRTRTAMAELVDRGVQFAVDDFGTGYSSLARLKELPAQIIKVDRRFVAGVGSDSSDFAVAGAVVDMARAMGRSCVAEGVETATQFHVLRGMGVDAYQGWLFSPAVPVNDIRALLLGKALPVPSV